MKLLITYLRRYRLTLVCAAVVLYLCLMPSPTMPVAQVPFADKWTHVVLFFTVCTVMWAEFWRSHTRHTKASRHVWIGVVLPAAFGGAIEIAQAHLTTTRSGDWLDFAADCVGVLLAALVGTRFLRRYAPKASDR